MSNLTEIVDINSLDYCGDKRQNPKEDNLVFSTNYPEVEIFEEVGNNDRAGRDSSILNVKALNSWEVWAGSDACKQVEGGHTRQVNALKFKDGVEGDTNAIQALEDSWMGIGLTQLIHGTGEDQVSLKDGGNQSLMRLGDHVAKTGTYLEVKYKRKIPAVGEKIKFREDFFTDYIQTNFLEEITYSASDSDYTYSTTELEAGYHYTAKITGKATRDDGTVTDGNFQDPQGDVSRRNVVGFAMSNTQAVPFRDQNASFQNGGEYTKFFTANKNGKIGFRLEDYDRTNTTGSFTIKLYRSVKQPIKTGVIIGTSGIIHIQKPFNSQGQSAEEYVVKSVNESTNQFTLKRSDLDTISNPVVTTHIISPTLGKWWDSGEVDCMIQVDGNSDDNTAFTYSVDLDTGEDEQKLDLFAIQANSAGLHITYNGRAWATITSKPCYSMSSKNITIGNPTASEVLSANTVTERYVRHFEWLFFDQELLTDTSGINWWNAQFSSEQYDKTKNDSFLYILSYLRCKYGYPWINGLEQIGEWKECKLQAPPLDVPDIDPPIQTCCFTNVFWTFMSHTYVTIHETTATAPKTYPYSSSGTVEGDAKQQTVTTDASGNTGTQCTGLPDTTHVWGQTGETQSGWTWNVYGPFGVPSSSQEVFPIPCIPPPNREKNRIKNKLGRFLSGLKSSTYQTSVEAQGQYTTISSYYSKPVISIDGTSDIGRYVAYGNSTGRISGITRSGKSTTYDITNLYAKNDVIAEGSETTTGSTQVTASSRGIVKYAYLSCKDRPFGGSWTYIKPIRDVFTYTLDIDTIVSSKTTIQSSSSISSEYPTKQQWVKYSELGNGIQLLTSTDIPPYTALDTVARLGDDLVSYPMFDENAKPFTFRVFEDDTVANEFTTTAYTTTETTTNYYGDFYTTSTASTSEVAFLGGDTEFRVFTYKLPVTSDYTLVRTKQVTLTGTFSTTMNALTYEGLDEANKDAHHYALCDEDKATRGLSYQAQIPRTQNYLHFFDGNLYEWAFSISGGLQIVKTQHYRIISGADHMRELAGNNSMTFRRMYNLNTYGDLPIHDWKGFDILSQRLDALEEAVYVLSPVEEAAQKRMYEKRNQQARQRRDFRNLTRKHRGSYYLGSGIWGEARPNFQGTSTSGVQPYKVTASHENSPDSTYTKYSTSSTSSTWNNIGGNTDLLVSGDPRLSAELAPYDRERNKGWPRPTFGSSSAGDYGTANPNYDYRDNFPWSERSTMPERPPAGAEPPYPPYDPYAKYYNPQPIPNSWWKIQTFAFTKLVTAQNECVE